MKNRKGFTIVELVIVIAVIAILAAVLIPTFSGVISKANQSSAQQEAASAMKVALAMSSDATLPAQTAFVSYDKNNAITYCYEYANNKLAETDAEGAKNMKIDGYTYDIDSVIVSVEYFLANNEESIKPVTAWAAATSNIKALCAKLNAFDSTKYSKLKFEESDKVWYKFVKEGTGYKLSIVKAATASDETAADIDVTVYTSVDLKQGIIVFVPKHTQTTTTSEPEPANP